MGIKKQTSHISTEQKTLFENWEKYRGAIVMVIGKKIFSTKQSKKVPEMLDNLEKKFGKSPLITYIPKEGTLILFYES